MCTNTSIIEQLEERFEFDNRRAAKIRQCHALWLLFESLMQGEQVNVLRQIQTRCERSSWLSYETGLNRSRDCQRQIQSRTCCR
ncbi:hypothetical protein OH492_29505 [Vibrio chagasii]|nr:hypothetical protein [Vibrio chagasii]